MTMPSPSLCRLRSRGSSRHTHRPAVDCNPDSGSVRLLNVRVMRGYRGYLSYEFHGSSQGPHPVAVDSNPDLAVAEPKFSKVDTVDAVDTRVDSASPKHREGGSNLYSPELADRWVNDAHFSAKLPKLFFGLGHPTARPDSKSERRKIVAKFGVGG